MKASQTTGCSMKTAAGWNLIVLVALALMMGCQGLQASKSSQQRNAGSSLTVTPVSVSFNKLQVGNNQSQRATLTNSGASTVTVNQVTASGVSFSVSGLTLPLTLPAGQSQTFHIIFAPQAAGSSIGNLAIVSSGSNTIKVPLSGNGLAAGSLTANPSSLNFGNVQAGNNLTLPGVLTNSGASNVTIPQVTVTGTGFSLNGLTTPLILAPSQRLTFNVVFSPLSAGNDRGSISVTSNASNPTLTIPLMGTGVVAGQLAISPLTVDFGNVAAGSHASQTVKLAATGSSVVVSSATVSSSEFIVSGPSLPVTIPAGKNVQFTVTFTPQASGQASTTASFAAHASNSPVTMSLSGTGQAQTVTEFNVANNGAVADATEGYNCAIAAGSPTLVCQDISFANSDATRAIAVYGAVANVNTKSTTAVSPGSVTVTPASMANITTGKVLFCANANDSNGEQLLVTGVTRTSFTANFKKSKSGTWKISSSYVALYTTITSVTNSSTVVLATPATQTVSSAMVQVAGATDNWKPIQNTINTACSASTKANPSTVLFPAGIYGLSNTIFIPNGCSYLTWTAQGQVVFLETTIVSTDPTQPGFGQGGALLAFSYQNAAGKGTALLSNNTSIRAGSNVLTCGSGCGFTTANIGQPLYLQYAGASALPLWTTITGVSGSPTGGRYPAVTLANNAQTTLPLNPQGMAGPAVVFGYQVMRNIDIGGIDFHNMGYWFHPGFTTIGYPLVTFGTAIQVVKQGLYFHDLKLVSATNGCLANNGPNDQYTLENVTCLGMTDSAFYMAGLNSNVTIKNVVVDNTQYPVPNTPLTNGFLLKSLSHALIENPTVRCHCLTYLIDIADYANFDTTIENANLNGEGGTPGGIGSNITSRLTVLNAQIQNIAGNVFRFDNSYMGSINGVTITGTNASNIKGGAIWINDGTGTGHGPSNITFDNNAMQVSANGINIQNVEGTNHWSGNRLTNTPPSSNAAWQIFQGRSGAINYVQSNIVGGYEGQSYCDSSCIF